MTMKPFGTDSAFFQDQDIKKCMCPNFWRAQFLFGVFGERILITLSRKSAHPNILGRGHNRAQNFVIRFKLKMNSVATSLSQADSRIALDTKALVDLYLKSCNDEILESKEKPRHTSAPVARSFHDWDRSQQNRRGNGGNFEENAPGQEAAGTNQSATHIEEFSE